MRLAPVVALAVAGTLSACVQTGSPAAPAAPVTQSNITQPQAPAPVPLTPGGRPGRPAVAFAPPQWQIGDQWQYSDGYGMRVVEVNGDTARFQRIDDEKQWFVARGPFREQTQSRAAMRQVVFRSEDPARLYTVPWGQAVVHLREYTRNGTLVRHRTSWMVEGTETITVPAGTFDTVILVKRTRSMTGNWTGYERWWYAPAIRNYVRLEYKYGEAPDGARVLTAFSVK